MEACIHHFVIRSVQKQRFRHESDVDAIPRPADIMYDRSEPALRSIAHHRSTNLLTCDNSNTTRMVVLCTVQYQQSDISGIDPFSLRKEKGHLSGRLNRGLH